MDNLHRHLAPISTAAWAEIEEETRRTFKLHCAGRHVVDTAGPEGPDFAAVGTGHLRPVPSPQPEVLTRAHRVRPVVELRVPFTLGREAVDDVERGSADSDWEPAKAAARTMALTEDRIIFEGWPDAAVEGIRTASDNEAIPLPPEVADYPDAVSRALTALRLAGVDGPYALLLGADAYTAVNETSDHGYPVRQHIARVLDGPIVWAPALSGGVVLSTRGGDFELHLGQDLSIGYLAHDERTVQLYLQQSLTFGLHSPEAAVSLT
ncbi:bacteriocin [Kitasatospora sp. MMS16-BH015]|uniref:family 1 encapsulin nanocompartment shell protein n=1 Tax=Kitasatospora sp. MMS16-BH015 TaxID=2018025 RepID=UPI000CA33D31|nr:family 1 encapsulin nanocompartment shell protein [Kitasatospora sp. MMS16-BH015]AUG75778.1 bacteriocin [Kitasatospora sp. MMS16-BH015]